MQINISIPQNPNYRAVAVGYVVRATDFLTGEVIICFHDKLESDNRNKIREVLCK